MGFFQKIGNAFARFMYGRNGGDHLGLALVWVSVALNIINIFVKNDTLYLVVNLASTVLMVWAIFRMFSKNLAKRRAENAKFLNKVWWPLKRRLGNAKQQAKDKDHKYFTCPACRTVCRVPRGKGKIVITCSKCRTQLQGKS
jgi:hypothetical protein